MQQCIQSTELNSQEEAVHAILLQEVYNMHEPTSTNLIAFEVGSPAGSKALFTAEALELRAHAERVAFHPFLLAPDAHDLHILYVIHWRAEDKTKQGKCHKKIYNFAKKNLSSTRASVAIRLKSSLMLTGANHPAFKNN